MISLPENNYWFKSDSNHCHSNEGYWNKADTYSRNCVPGGRIVTVFDWIDLFDWLGKKYNVLQSFVERSTADRIFVVMWSILFWLLLIRYPEGTQQWEDNRREQIRTRARTIIGTRTTVWSRRLGYTYENRWFSFAILVTSIPLKSSRYIAI